jgi:hypothetical protein
MSVLGESRASTTSAEELAVVFTLEQPNKANSAGSVHSADSPTPLARIHKPQTSSKPITPRPPGPTINPSLALPLRPPSSAWPVSSPPSSIAKPS